VLRDACRSKEAVQPTDDLELRDVLKVVPSMADSESRDVWTDAARLFGGCLLDSRVVLCCPARDGEQKQHYQHRNLFHLEAHCTQ
jgi:hypothetical protein